MKKCLLFVLVLFVCINFNNNLVAQQREYVVSPQNSRWDSSNDGTTYIPVCWENAENFSNEKQWVKSSIETTWEEYANIDFHGWEKCLENSRGIRILVIDNRSNSYVGNYLDGRPDGMNLNFTFRNFAPHCQNTKEYCIKAIAIHEFGHALGLTHEQNREDSLCKEDQKLSNNFISLTPYDKDSVMNYCNRNWSDGKLSFYDIQGIQTIYGKKLGYVYVTDELGKDQVWEELAISLEGSVKNISINKLNPKEKIEWSFLGTGTYCFKFSTKALYTDGVIREGYGNKCFNLTSGTRYATLNLAYDKDSDLNKNGYFSLTLE
jgi:hypothetical protein